MKKATVFIKGGFGNQLFQFCFANYLQEKGFKVNVNTDLFHTPSNDTPRDLTLPISYFGFDEQKNFDKKKFEIFHKINSSRTIKKSLLGKYFEEYRFIKENIDFENMKYKKYFFNGYWKNIKYILNNKGYLISSLSNSELLESAFNFETKKNYAMVHVRRGDFIKDDRHLNVSYYEKSLVLLHEKLKNVKFDIFTDDEDWEKKQKIFTKAENIFAQEGGKNNNPVNPEIDGKDDREETISTFAKMLGYENFIAGNSSFAFWAAFLRSKNNSFITVPHPWFRNNEHPTLKKDGWLVVANI